MREVNEVCIICLDSVSKGGSCCSGMCIEVYYIYVKCVHCILYIVLCCCAQSATSIMQKEEVVFRFTIITSGSQKARWSLSFQSPASRIEVDGGRLLRRNGEHIICVHIRMYADPSQGIVANSSMIPDSAPPPNRTPPLGISDWTAR